jgi:preprotein translocase subunit SecA
LLGYANKNPKNAYKIEGFSLFRAMWENIAQTVLDQVLQMRLSEEDKRRAEEGAEYESTLTRASQRRERSTATTRQSGQLEKLDAAAKAAVAKLKAASLGTPESVSVAVPGPPERRAPTPPPPPSVDATIEASVAQAIAAAKVQKDGAKKSGRKRRSKKVEESAP